jgi:hypothetical protein
MLVNPGVAGEKFEAEKEVEGNLRCGRRRRRRKRRDGRGNSMQTRNHAEK